MRCVVHKASFRAGQNVRDGSYNRSSVVCCQAIFAIFNACTSVAHLLFH